MNYPGSARERIIKRRRAAARRDAVTAGKFVAAFTLILAAFYVIESWGFMLGVGAVHAQWLTGMPTIGFKATLAILWFFNLFIAGGAAASNSRSSK